MTWTSGADQLYPVFLSKESIEISKQKVQQANAAFKPHYGVQAVYKQRDSGDNFAGDDWFGVQASITIPVWSKSNQQPKLNAAKAQERKAIFMYENQRRKWLATMLTLQAERESVVQNIALLKKKKKRLLSE